MTTPSVEKLKLPSATRTAIAGWLEREGYASQREALERIVATALGGDGAALAELEEAFVGPLPIGTGGRRGPCGPGPNRMNAVVLRETAVGLARAMRDAGDPEAVVVVYDTRASSREFARLVSTQLAVDGLRVHLLDAPRPTPQLSYLVRHLRAGAGIVISASHNPPRDNGIKIYGPDGAQVLGERDAALMRAIEDAGEATADREPLPAEMPNTVECLDVAEADRVYHAHVLEQGAGDSLAGTGLVVTYSPLHGVGHSAVIPVLRARGIEVIPVERQCDADGGRFSTVESANPEAPAAMDMVVTLALEVGADLALATDPDADRLGACVREPNGEFTFIDGNRIGVLMLDHLLAGDLPADGIVITTLVTTRLISRMCEEHPVECVDDLLVGFKHHAGIVRERENPVVFACEESHGYLRGRGVRDKDGAIAALVLAEAAAADKAAGRTLIDRLEGVWSRIGYHRERTASIFARGLTGKAQVQALMQRWRAEAPTAFGGLRVAERFDRRTPRNTGSKTRDLLGDVLGFELEGEGVSCRVVLRPSGTEPKLKVYVLAGEDRPRGPEGWKAVDALVERVLADAEAMARAVMVEAGGDP